jgi:hypothetical protein
MALLYRPVVNIRKIKSIILKLLITIRAGIFDHYKGIGSLPFTSF